MKDGKCSQLYLFPKNVNVRCRRGYIPIRVESREKLFSRWWKTNEKYLLNYILIIKLFASRERLHFSVVDILFLLFLYFCSCLVTTSSEMNSQKMKKIACNTCVIIKLEPFWLKCKAAKISENVKTSSVFHQKTPLTRRPTNFTAVVAGPRVLEGWTNSVKLQGFFCFATQENFWLFLFLSVVP